MPGQFQCYDDYDVVCNPSQCDLGDPDCCEPEDQCDGVPCGQYVGTIPMFRSEGSPFATFRNITWDANGKEYIVAFDASPPPATCSATGEVCGGGAGCEGTNNTCVGRSDTFTAHIDSTFKNAWIGLRAGTEQFQSSENSLRRCRFENNFIGFSNDDSNALNWWIWDSVFTGNSIGITNYAKNFGSNWADWGGDFRVHGGGFHNNLWDVYVAARGHVTLRDVASTGSGALLYAVGPTSAAGTTTILGAVVDEFSFDHAVDYRSGGTLTFVGNVVDSGPNAPGTKTVFASSPGPTSLLALDNAFAATLPTAPFYATEIEDETLEVTGWETDYGISAFDIDPPSVPAVADPFTGRIVYPVPRCASDAGIPSCQSAIEKTVAEASLGTTPKMVHLPAGVYEIDDTISIGSGADLVVIGDGAGATSLRWDSTGTNGPMLSVDADDVEELVCRDLELDSSSTLRADAIEIANVDDTTSAVLLHRVYVNSLIDSSVGITVTSVDNAKVDLVDSGIRGRPHANMNGGIDCEVENSIQTSFGLHVDDGPSTSPPGTLFWSGVITGNDTDFVVTNDDGAARVLISGVYSENSRQSLDVMTGTGGNENSADSSVTIHNSTFAQTSCEEATAAYAFDDYEGSASVLSTRFGEALIDASHDGLDVLLAGGSVTGAIVQLIGNTISHVPEFSPSSATGVVTAGERYECQDQAGAFPPECEAFVRCPGTQVLSCTVGEPTCADGETPLCDGDDQLDPPTCSGAGTPFCSSTKSSVPLPGDATNQDVADGFELLRCPRPGTGACPAHQYPALYDETQSTESNPITLDGILVFSPEDGIRICGGACP